MRLTTRTRYAARALADLANHSVNAPVSLPAIARRQAITRKYLGKIFRHLLRARLISSKKGPGGGYVLARDPRSITLKDIMAAVGDAQTLVFCVAVKNQKKCPRQNNCPTRPCWKEFSEIIDDFCRNLTIHDIAQNAESKKK